MADESLQHRSTQVAIFCGGSLASLIQVTPLLRAFRERAPHLERFLIARSDTAPLLIGTPLADRVLALPRAAWHGGMRAWLPVARMARRRVTTMLLDRPTLCGISWDRSPRLARAAGSWMARAEVPHRYGFVREPAWLFTDVVPDLPPPGRHESMRMRLLLRVLDLPGFECSPDLALTRGERQRARATLARLGIDVTRPLVAVNPAADHRLKEWSPGRYAELLSTLPEGVERLVIGWGRPTRAMRVAQLVRGPAPAIFATRHPRELAAILTRCALLVTGDSDPMHLAAAVGTPVVALYGPTDPEWFGPLGGQHQILRLRLRCSPCAVDDRVPPCPYGQACLRDLPLEPVRDAVLRALRSRQAAPIELEARVPT